MEIFGIGPMELLLVLIIALMVFGPDKLPEIGAKLGKAMREMRQATRQFSQEIEQTREAIEAPIKEVSEPLREAAATAATVGQAVAHPAEAIGDSLMRNLGLKEDGKTETQPPEAATTAIGSYADVALEAPDEAAIGQAIGAPSAGDTIAAMPAEPASADEAPLPFTATEVPAVVGATLEPEPTPEPLPASLAPAPLRLIEGTDATLTYEA